MADYEEHFDGEPEPEDGRLADAVVAARKHPREVDYKKLYTDAIAAAAPVLQAGGRYVHLVPWGASILKDGVPALAKALDAALSQNRSLKAWSPPGHLAHRLYLRRLRKLLNDFETTARLYERSRSGDPKAKETAFKNYDRAKAVLEKKLLLGKGWRYS